MTSRPRAKARRSSTSALVALGLGLAGCAGQCSSCFRAGTRVRARSGSRRIEELGVGDVVIGFDPETKRLVESTVLRTWVHDDRPLRRLRADDVDTFTTAEHPYFVAGRGFRRVDVLDPGAALLRWSGGESLLESPLRSIDAVVAHDRVFNLHVSGPSTYFADGLLVHNKSPGPEVDEPCDCYRGGMCAAYDFDGDGYGFTLDCDDSDPAVGRCGIGEMPRRYPGCPDRFDAGADAGPDASSADAGEPDADVDIDADAGP